MIVICCTKCGKSIINVQIINGSLVAKCTECGEKKEFPGEMK